MRVVAVAVLVSTLLGGCVPVIEGEDAENGIQPLMGYANPEDLAVVIGTGWLVVSEYSHHGEKPGGLSFHRVSDKKKEVADLPGSLDRETWGEPACSTFPPRVESFHPHGIDIVKRNGALQLLVVNHRGTKKHTEQERIDFFEIHLPGKSQEIPKLTWRGCVKMPEHTRPNDVAAMPDGRGFVVSNMGASWFLARSALGLNTGEIWAWSVDRWNCRAVQGWCKVAGSEAPAPNGVAVSPDGRHLFFSAYTERQVIRIGGDGSERKKSTALAITPDNLTWSG